MAARYRIGIDDAWTAPQLSRRAAVRQAVAHARKAGLPGKIRWPWRKDFGPQRRAGGLTFRLARGLIRMQLGDVVSIAADSQRIRIRKEQGDRGALVVRRALSQLGVRYIWADADPNLPGPDSSGFDCSGLTMWAVEGVGVQLPHNAEAQRTSSLVTVFMDRSKLELGDLVFYHTGRLVNPSEADHVGIYAGGGTVVDASSGLGYVVHRDIDSNPVLSFGRIAAVNGAL